NFSIAYGIYTAPPSADNTPPSAVSNLTAIAGSDDGEVKLTWTAPGDDGAGGNVSSGLYRINASTYNITSANFGSITNNGKYTFTVDISTSYTTQGTEHSYGFSGLYPGTTYYFAIKLRDENAANWASWSDTASSSDTAPAQDLAPPAPSGLNANPGESKIALTWTEVSGEPDLDYYKIYRDSSTPYDYADAYTIEVDTGNSSYLDTGLSNTVTYYYKMTVVDLGDSGNGLFSHARESAFSNEKSTRPLAEMPTPEAFLTYYSSSTTQSLNETPQCGSWNGSSWASGYDIKRITQTATGWYIVKKCPTAAKWLFGIQDPAKVLNVMIYDESTKAWSAPKKLTTSISYDGCRGFDIEFEQQSGRAVIVYKGADTKIPQALTWTDSGGWGSAFALSISTNGAGTIAWLELVPKPNSDDMILMIGDSLKDLSAHVWFSTSTQTGSSILLDTDIETYGQQCFDAAYEMQSGDAMVAWDNDAGQIRYRILSGNSWGNEQAGPQDIGANIWWVKLAANPNNDAIILGTLDGATPYDVNVSTWNGSNWGTTTEVTPSASAYTTKPFDIAWETVSGDGLVVFNDGTSVPKARRLSAGAWGAETSASDVAAAPCFVQLVSDNNTDDILLVTCNADTTPDIHAQKWDGAANSFGSATLITNNSANQNGSSYSHNFAVAYPYVQPTDNTAPAAITTLSASSTTTTGEIRLEWEAPGDNDWSGTLGTYDNNAQFRIQYATYTAFAFGDHTTYGVSIDTYSVNPYDVQSKLITLSKETTYYFRIWTRDELSAGNWSGISYGATCWVRIAPAAITTLSALAIDDGDVSLSWIAPGDDGTTGAITGGQWKIRYSTISTVDWTTTSAGWTDYDDKYELLIDTSCAALSEHAKTLTGLHGGVTYYFRIWTRDEATGINAPGNWSSISNGSTATVVKIIGISVYPSAYGYGGLAVSSCVVNTATITVTNDGNVYETYSIFSSSASNAGGGTGWTIDAVNPQTPGNNIFSLSAGFYAVQPSTDSFNSEAGNKEDALLGDIQEATDTKFSITGAQTQTGVNVPKTETRNLWLLLKTPTEVSTRAEKTITVTITAGESSP
ncbi:fibronectin type III domain-containing protein, partial [bacterium]|nr:fibronectin type III domain-containing protein [bacterium]